MIRRILPLLAAFLLVHAQPELSLPFNAGVGSSRFVNFAGGNQPIQLYVKHNISESAPVNSLITTIGASQDHSNSNSKLPFRIDRTTDPKRQFSIDQNGNLYTAQRLDREEFPFYKLGIEAYDSNGNIGRLGVEITVMDVNDNSPIPYTVPTQCIFMENTDPSMQPTCEIRAYDRDERQNGPPFTMEVGPGFKYGNFLSITFDQAGDNGNGSMTVKALVPFDREAEFPGKSIAIPVIITDNGGLRSERDVYVFIGDQNDNPMHDGRMTIYVHSYQGRLEKTMIGRVFVEDKDDWDNGDKEYTWEDRGNSDFSLSPNGDITMGPGMKPGVYELVAKVIDKKRNEEARGWVRVVVSALPDAAFQNQGSLRILKGPGGYQSASDFLQQDANGESPMKRFMDAMYEWLKGSTAITVFSVKEDRADLQTDTVEVIDVRFSAHASKDRSSVLLNGIVAQHKSEIEKLLGAPIVSVGIDMCKFTLCDNGCQTENSADFSGVVVSANRTVLVGVNAFSKDKCVCPVFDPPAQCEAGVCYNDGVCHNTNPGFFCECRNNMLKGFRCQGTTRSFDGNGFAWFKPMPACTSLNITFEFMTKEPNAMLLYNGPMGRNSSAPVVDYGDFISIQLMGGMLSVDMNLNGRSPAHLEIPRSPKLNDGKWHTVALTQIGRSLELVLDSCMDLQPDDANDGTTCRKSERTMDDDERLNIVAPLQVGGVAPLSGNAEYPGVVTITNGLKGCLRNLYVNNDQYDLATPARAENSKEGCGFWGSACDSNSIDSLNYCVNGDCYADMDTQVPKCICDPGYSGDRCDMQVGWVEFGPGASIGYNVLVDLTKQLTSTGVLFIAGKANAGSGQLGYGSNAERGSVSTYIENYAPKAEFDAMRGANTDQIKLALTQMRLHANTSYWMQFNRNPTRASLSIDGIYHTSEILNPVGSQSQAYMLPISDIQLGTGGAFGHGFMGCVGTFRWDHKNLPLQREEGAKPGALRHARQVPPTQSTELFTIKQISGIKEGCSLRLTCASLSCPAPYVCNDRHFKGAVCTCPEGNRPLIDERGVLEGCGEMLAVSTLGVTTSTIVIVMGCIALLLLAMLVIFMYAARSGKSIAQDVRPEDMKRDNLRPYDVEGGGEADNTRHNIAGLRKPVMPIDGADLGPAKAFPAPRPIDDKLNSRINDLETDPNTGPYDELRMYNTEGDNVSRLTLDSLESASDETPNGPVDQDSERWGPRFNDYGHRE
ncbi:hypothetical protein QR680_010233 [Steinernema hermaphroditum]|uniref:Cadherin domain-containing protein n=1 Tax=Steinernema hermaphroditum TaxID=289476 RepID=A0AA39IPX1_9BILA|nr:hypothetical protein QR680_010233 [Steinernema hermaphroditum]